MKWKSVVLKEKISDKLNTPWFNWAKNIHEMGLVWRTLTSGVGQTDIEDGQEAQRQEIG